MIKPTNKLAILLNQELEDLHAAELVLLEELPAIAKEVTASDLKQFFTERLEETKKQVSQLEKCLALLGKKAKSETSLSMKTLAEDLKRIGKHYDENTALKDAALIGLYQKIEHYQISAYGTACAHAKLLKLEDAILPLQTGLEAAVTADRMMTKIAEGTFYAGGVNAKAMKVGKKAAAK